jgi:hypothetical protein
VAATFLGFFLLGGIQFHILNVLGITLNMAGGVWYSIIKYNSKQHRQLTKAISYTALNAAQNAFGGLGGAKAADPDAGGGEAAYGEGSNPKDGLLSRMTDGPGQAGQAAPFWDTWKLWRVPNE